MHIKSTPVRVAPRARVLAPSWELGVRYAAAYICTLLAIVAAQPKIGFAFAACLYGVTALGLPISLALRRRGLRWRGYSVNRRAVNGVIFFSAVLTSAVYLQSNLPGIVPGEDLNSYLLRLDARAIELLMGVFLIVAVCRCMFILNDKDALLCTVPSFSVLLLLSVVHREVSVLVFFVLWSVATAVLLALDHRSESRLCLSGTVPSVVPGQDIAVSTRSLCTIIGLSLACSLVLSYRVASRETSERSSAETWLFNMVTRLNSFGMERPQSGVSGGPERTIDYTSAPALPSRAIAWRVQVREVETGRSVQPAYWRMFTLNRYDGRTWSQDGRNDYGRENGLLPLWRVPQERLQWDEWQTVFSGENFMAGVPRRARNSPGFDVAVHSPDAQGLLYAFGPPRTRIVQTLTAVTATSGYLPTLPAVQRLQLEDFSRSAVIARSDQAIDVGYLASNSVPQIYSYLPDTTASTLPVRRGDTPNPNARLSNEERSKYLQLPPQTPQRVLDLARRVAKPKSPEDGDLRRARRLANFVESNATYTLYPPTTPPSRDAVDHFLFNSRRGYCTYFAGALTVLCRAAGIPARVVSGFANPEWESRGGLTRGTIREANAHAWTEAWIDGWGWVTLDSTPSDDRGDNAPSLLENVGEALRASLQNGITWGKRHVLMLLGGLMLALVGAHAFVNLSNGDSLWRRLFRNFQQRSPRGSTEDEVARREVVQHYERAAAQLTRRFRRRAAWETSQEWIAAAEAALHLQEPQPLRVLTDLYTRAVYSPRQLDRHAIETARLMQKQLSWRKVPAETAVKSTRQSA
ncbi:MAG TPA: transglutaminase domain-containing protein [Abditibacteriaceae bacterium]